MATRAEGPDLRERFDPFRAPFGARAGAKYATASRPAFGDLDSRLVEAWASELGSAQVVLDVGCGEGHFARELRRRYPRLTIIGIEPGHAGAENDVLRARAEALPLSDGSCDVAVAFSSLRHVRDRGAAFRELRRVVRAGGVLHVVELDPRAPRASVHHHVRGLTRAVSRLVFRPIVLGCAPRAELVLAAASEAGWRLGDLARDPVQPVYRMRLV